jgi:hypothetical protein
MDALDRMLAAAAVALGICLATPTAASIAW